MSEYAKNIQTIEDVWKKRIELPKLTEVVRCRDCKRFYTNTNGLDCPKLDPDGFCAWGIKKVDA